MRFIDCNLRDKLCFISDKEAKGLSPCFNEIAEYTDDVFYEFVNLNVKNLQFYYANTGLECFAKKYGSLMIEDWLDSFQIPNGLSTFQLQNFDKKSTVSEVFFEKKDFWSDQIAIFYDIVILHYLQSHKNRFNYFYVVKQMIENLIYYIDDDKTPYYVYHSSVSVRDDEDRIANLMPSKVQGFLKVIGKPFIYRAVNENIEDTLENRQKWLSKNVYNILNNYMETYFKYQGVNEVHLLGKLQTTLEEVVEMKKGPGICSVCGKLYKYKSYSDRTKTATGNFCSTVCQSRYYAKKDEVTAELPKNTCFDTEDYTKLFLVSTKRQQVTQPHATRQLFLT